MAIPLERVDYKLDNSPMIAETLDLLISSLKEVIVNVHVYDYEGLSDDLRKMMRDCGWTIKVTKLEDSEYDLGKMSMQITSTISLEKFVPITPFSQHLSPERHLASAQGC